MATAPGRTDPTNELVPFVPSQLDELRLDPLAFRVLAHLWRRAGRDGQMFDATTTIAKTCVMSRRSVQRALDVLVELGLARRLERGRGGAAVAVYATVAPSLWPTPEQVASSRQPRLTDAVPRLSGPVARPIDAVPRPVGPHPGQDEGATGPVGRSNRASQAQEGNPLKVVQQEGNWDDVVRALAVDMPPHLQATWLRPLDGRVVGDSMVITAPGTMHLQWLSRNRSRILAALKEAHLDVGVRFVQQQGVA